MELEEVKKVVEDYFSDTSRPAAETKEGLEVLLADIEEFLNCLD